MEDALETKAVAVGSAEVICFLRYELEPGKLEAFERYAAMWTKLIERHGGRHLGYFLPAEAAPPPNFSFPAVGKAGPENVAIALFSFPSASAYELYRTDVKNDPECRIAEQIYQESGCFRSYERSFVRRLGEMLRAPARGDKAADGPTG